MKRLWSNSLAAKIFLSYLAVVGLLFASFYFFSGAMLEKLYVTSLEKRLEREARLLGETIPSGLDNDSLDAVLRGLSEKIDARITIMAADGRVLGDSAESSSLMENHAGRPEILGALAKGSGFANRYSTTIERNLLYRAILQTGGEQERVIRLAIPTADIETATGDLGRNLLLGLLAVSGLGLLIAYAFSYHVSRRFARLVEFSRQMGAGSFPQNFFSGKGRDEIDILEQHLNDMSRNARDHFRQVVAEKEKANLILRCMIEGVLVLDLRGRVLVINDQAKKLFRVPPDHEVLGNSMAELSRHPEILRTIQDVLAFDFVNRRYSKEVELDEGLCVRVNAVSVKGGGGEIFGLILVFHDISEIKRLETVRADFVANVSHELRTPLTAIRGYVETLLQSPPSDPADARHFLEIVERHTERLGRLTEDLLTLSDLESGKFSLAPRPVDIAQLVQRVLEIFWKLAEKKNIKLTKQIDRNLPPLIGDFDRLQQLFVNLVDNAVKFTPSNGTVTISATAAQANGEGTPMLEIAVTDTGTGIPQKDIARLTERFYRVDKARSRELGGTGLGLAIVKHIVQAHQGRLTIESAVQKGTKVRVDLPASAEAKNRKTILFLCTGNSCRSQMAEGFARELGSNGHRIYSAGTEPKAIHPMTVTVMKESGIDISNHRSKGLDAVPLDDVDLVITLCGDAAETCVNLPLNATRDHWPLPDPSLAQGNEKQMLQVFREVRDNIRARVGKLLMEAGL